MLTAAIAHATQATETPRPVARNARMHILIMIVESPSGGSIFFPVMSKQGPSRFNLLALEEGEYFFDVRGGRAARSAVWALLWG